jgi:hypothetical protein
MKKLIYLIVVILALSIGVLSSTAIGSGINDPAGVPLYVIIEVSWDGVSLNGDWTVWGPKWDPEVGVGTLLSSCTDCLEMNYTFTLKGKTVQFDEIYVESVDATPQVRHVVLHDPDGDGTYTGSLSAEHYNLEDSGAILYMDRIDYEISFDKDGNCIKFHYLEYEHKKMIKEK